MSDVSNSVNTFFTDAPIETNVDLSKSDGNNSNQVTWDEVEDLTAPKEDPKPVEQEVPKEEPEAEKVVDPGEAPAPNKKMLEVLIGDQKVEVAADGLIPVKVDGQDVQVPIQELINNYSGKTAWDKKFQELGSEKKYFETERKVIEDKLGLLAKAVESKDSSAVFNALANLSNLNPLEFKDKLRESLAPEMVKFAQMTPEQREQMKMKEELEFYRSEQARLAEQQKEQAAVAELENEVKRVEQTHGLTREQLSSYYQDLQQHVQGEITVAMLEQYHVQLTAVNNGMEILKEINPQLVNDQRVLDEVTNALINPLYKDWTKEDWKEVLKQAYGSQPDPVAVVNEKLPPKEKAKMAGTPKQQQQIDDSIWSLDQL